MYRPLIASGLLCFCGLLPAQTGKAPYPPFTAQQAELGKQLIATSNELGRQASANEPAEPFKIMGNLYFVGNARGESYLLTSPQGHILMGVGQADQEKVQKNIESLGFKMTDIKVILVNHNHAAQSSGAAYIKEKSGAQVMAGFAEIPYIEHGTVNPPAIPIARAEGGGRGPAAPARYPAVKVDRALFDGDVVKVGPLNVAVYLMPGHSPSPATFAFSVKDGGREYKVVEYCCWEFPEDLSSNTYITEASVRHMFETFKKLYPVDIYLETGAYAWSGVLGQPSGTFAERMAKVRANTKLFVNREIFSALTAAREVEFEEKLAKTKSSSSTAALR